MNNLIIRPQPGPQEAFLESSADIVIYGGAAGGGKTYGLLLTAANTMLSVPNVNGILFRRRSIDLHSAGGVWDEASNLFPALGMTSVKQPYSKWKCSNRSSLQMAGLQLESDRENFKGSQFDVLLFDELTQFSETQFWYLIGRARSATGNVKPFIRAATNPEPNWVCDMIRWWLTEDGYADSKKSGIVRWFYRFENTIYWFKSEGDCCTDLLEKGLDKTVFPMSFTFIPAKLDDNQILMQNDPRYIARLAAMDTLDRKRLLEGNWFVKAVGKVFKVSDFQHFAIAPQNMEVKIITVDTAQQTNSANDYTVAQVWGRWEGKAYLLASIRGKFDFLQQVQVIKNLAIQYKPNWIIVEQAANGLPLLQTLRKEAQLPLFTITRNKDKYQRAMEIQGYIQSGYVFLNPNALYYPELIGELTTFSEKGKDRNRVGMHDDQVDALVDAVYYLLYNKIGHVEKDSPQPTKDQQKGLFGYGTRQPLQRPQFDSISHRR